MRRWLAAVTIMSAVCVAQAQDRARAYVAPDGKDGAYKTVQAALDASSDGTAIYIAPGVYREKLRITKNKIALIGTGKAPDDVVLTWDDSAGTAGGTGKSFSVSVTGDDFSADNLTIENDF